MKRRSYPITNIGSVSLLMIFIILCLVVFSSLSLSGAVSDHQYSQKIAQHNAEYYQASAQATRILREIDQILHNTYQKSPADYYTAAGDELTAMESLSTDLGSESPSITYEVPVGERQMLKVVLALNEPGQLKDGYYRIISWQEVPASTWNGDDSLNLMTF